MSKEYQKYQGTESHFQQTVATYLNQLGVFFYHCPNGGNRNYKEAAKMKREGVKAGIPDICICEPRGAYHGFYIELKVGYNKPSNKQQEVMDQLKVRGYKVEWSNSLDEVIDLIDEYLKQ
jgi:hypothetical protein